MGLLELNRIYCILVFFLCRKGNKENLSLVRLCVYFMCLDSVRNFFLFPFGQYLVGYGGGSVSGSSGSLSQHEDSHSYFRIVGDEIIIHINISESATVAIFTQGSPKIYRSVGMQQCVQKTCAEIGPNAFLLQLPDPTTLFSGARLNLCQLYNLSASGRQVKLCMH